MKNLRVVFMGTPNFSVPVLENLIKNTNVILVVTSPDAYVGRKKVLTPCPVKELALKNNIEVFSPVKIRNDFDKIVALKPDIIITCAYGQIITKELIDLPFLGCINVHASLLPKYRGGAPIHRAIINGDEKTGITIMYMDVGMDSGDIITSKEIPIENNDNLETLSNKLSLLGSQMIIETLPSIIDKTCDRIIQNPDEVTFAPIIKREAEKINFNQSAQEVYNYFRAFSPAPLAYFTLDNLEYKIVECEVSPGQGEVGSITNIEKDSFTIMCNDHGLKITKIKPIGKNIMSIKDFFNGYKSSNMLGKVVNNEEQI